MNGIALELHNGTQLLCPIRRSARARQRPPGLRCRFPRIPSRQPDEENLNAFEAIIVREFSGGWYSKANFEDGISQRKAKGFVNYALTKLRREIKIRGERDG